MIFHAVSIQQPWADAIIVHGKDIENRTWKCPAQFLNRTILIHAGKRVDKEANIYYHPELQEVFKKGFLKGGIVGALTITSGHKFHLPSRWAGDCCFNWELTHARRVPFSPIRGHLAFSRSITRMEVPS
ncbi:MAG: hypothetical protein FWG59_05145 [Betaproteobacteria bacterium]|nr:hypothetical protein [Betaproteobacteria bacterium]